jgi:integrase
VLLRRKARPETVATYRRQLDQRILPAFGSRKIAAIRPNDIGNFINDLKTAPTQNGRNGTLRPGSIRRIFGPLNAVLRYAVDADYIRANPARHIQLPDSASLNVDDFEGTALEWSTVVKVAGQTAKVDPMYGLIVRFLACTGLRASELSGLQIGDYSPGSIRVVRTAQRDSKVSNGIRYGKPKSKASRRVVPLMSPGVEAELSAYIDAHPLRDDPTAPLFPTRRFGGEHDRSLRKSDPFNWSRPIDPGNFRRRVFLPACSEVGVCKIRLHDLRVTAGSLWLASGIGLWQVSRYLGHQSPELTARVYAKQLDSSIAVDARRFAAYLAGITDGTVTPLRRFGS